MKRVGLRPYNLVGRNHPVLHTPAAEVDDPTTEAMHELSSRMIATCRVKRGLALAAPQIGVSLQIVVNLEGHVWFNPTWAPDGDETETTIEACLSLPGRRYRVERYTAVTMEAVTLSGEPTTGAEVGLLARMWQHECDHLDGQLISEFREERGALVGAVAL